MQDCLIAFGSNQGNRLEMLYAATDQLNQSAEIRVTATSAPLQTAPIGGPEEQASYLNSAIRLQTSLGPDELHRRLIEIENELGRNRRTRWGSRTIDLDLLLFGQQQIKTDELLVPHPRMSFRRFVLEPACQIAGEMVHPTSGKTLDQLVARLNLASDLVLSVCESPFKEGMLSIRTDILGEANSNWDLQVACQLSQFREFEQKAKLVTYFEPPETVQQGDRQDDTSLILRSAAISFSGPTLGLPRDDRNAKLEILAAIAAMAPLD